MYLCINKGTFVSLYMYVYMYMYMYMYMRRLARMFVGMDVCT